MHKDEEDVWEWIYNILGLVVVNKMYCDRYE
jgi:hypothetical protein